MTLHKESPPSTATSALVGTLSAGLAQVHARIQSAERASGRAAGSVSLLAVSKAQPAESVRVLAGLGQRMFGESYVQEASTKIEALAGLDIEWHFVGALQSNKTRAVAARFAWVHAVDRLRIARRLSEQRPPELPPLNVCLEVNLDREPSKSGADPEQVIELALQVAELPRLRLRGLMAIPAARGYQLLQREPFRRLRELKEMMAQTGLALDTLSMGMSADLEAAVAEGATVVRIGTALFGPRPAKD